MVGVVLTLLGLAVLVFHWTVMTATGVVFNTGTLLCCFPICGLFWHWPPDPSSLSSLLLFVCMGGHWMAIGWVLDRWLVHRQSAGA